jgi:hypothetical protein
MLEREDGDREDYKTRTLGNDVGIHLKLKNANL